MITFNCLACGDRDITISAHSCRTVPRSLEKFNVTERQANALTNILGERLRQDKKWGDKPGEWKCSAAIKLAVLAEEFGEVARGLLERNAKNVREELVQVAAVALKWLEAYDSFEIENRTQDGTG